MHGKNAVNDGNVPRQHHLLARQVPSRITYMPKKYLRITEQLRQAIIADHKTRYRISQETGVTEAALSRFVNQKGGLSPESIDKIGECLGLWLTTEVPKRPTKKGK